MFSLFSCDRKEEKTDIDNQIDNLLSIMTIEEKIGQLCCPIGFDLYEKNTDSIYICNSLKEMIVNDNIGSLYAVMRACPWSKKTLESGLDTKESAVLLNEIQRYNMEHSRLKIPLLFIEECSHGHMALEATVFPVGIAQASTWNRNLLEKMGEVISEEASLRGASVAYGPVLDIARDPRWSRIEEGLGEDTYLCAILGNAITQGIQKNMASTLKHFAAYGIPEGGHNGSDANIGKRKLMNDFLPAFRKSIQNGARCIMTSYNCIDGIPCTSNTWLLQDILRNEWDFKGVVFSDLNSISALHATHRIAENHEEAAALAINAGVDIDLGNSNYGKYLKDAIQNNLVDMNTLDNAVKRVLKLKFDLGLFENPYIDIPDNNMINNEEHKKVALQIAREGTILLKNNGILPLNNDIKSIAIIGPNADNTYNQLGDYTAAQHPDNVTTILEGIKNKVSRNTEITYIKGCDIRDTVNSDIETAVKASQNAEVTILVVGSSSARSFKTSYEKTGAAIVNNHIDDMDCGEGYDRSSLSLSGKQELLLSELSKTNKPLIIIYVQGRPLLMNNANTHADAILNAWYPGQEGGHALADIIFGDYNPSGKLPISIPENIGQIPVYYSLNEQHEYVDGNSEPLFEFGFGLSYTDFLYENMKIINENDTIKISADITNTGKYDGEEIIQLYVRDNIASVAPANKLLKGFEKIHLNKNEKKEVHFILTKDDLKILDKDLKWTFEEGEFIIMLASSSDNIRLSEKIFIEN